MAGTTGLEPATSAVTGQRSNQLNYVPSEPFKHKGLMGDEPYNIYVFVRQVVFKPEPDHLREPRLPGR
jgi:hypothetical protein